MRLADAERGPDRFSIVANKVQDEADVSRIAARLDRPVDAVVPLAHPVLAGDRRALAPLDADPDGKFVKSVSALVDQLTLIYDGHKEAQ